MKKYSIKEKEEEFRRKEVLKIALTVFSKKGYFKTKVSDIAKECGLSVGTIYNMFQTKENLYASVIEYWVEDNLKRVEEETCKGLDVLDMMRRMARAYFTLADESRDFFRIFLTESAYPSRDRIVKWRERLFKIFQRHLQFVERIVSPNVREDLEHNSRLVALVILGIIHHLITFHMRNNLPVKPDALSSFFISVIKQGIFKEEICSEELL